ncbi:MAG: TolC family protein [Cyclobacteriaceae bacterium]
MKRLFIFLVSVSVISHLFGQDSTTVITLSDALSTALEKNYNIRMARNDVVIANNNNTLGNAGFLPALTATGNYDRSSQNTEQTFASGDTQSRTGAVRKNYGGSVNMNWTLFDGTRMFATQDRLEQQEQLVGHELKIEVDNSISQLMINFYQIAFEDARLDLLEANIEFSLERLRIAEEKYALGKESKMSKLQAQVDYNSDKFSLLRQKEFLTSLKLQLLNQMGVDPMDFDVSYTFEIDSSLIADELLASSTNQNPLLLAQTTNQQVLKNQMLEIDRSKWPQLDFTMGYGYTNLESEAGFLALNQTYDFRYGLRLNFDLFNGFNQRRQFQNSQVLIETGKIQMEQAEKQIETSILTTYTSYSNNLELARFEQQNLAVAQENSEIALERFKLGSSDALELREAQTNSVNAQIRYLQALYNAKVAEIELNRLAGRLTQVYR